ncbi:MAG: hypothetical protein ACOYJ6_09850 [Caulobacterales bacterium]
MSVSLLTIGYFAQIALYGAAGAMFIRAHLEGRKMMQARNDLPAWQRWKTFRFPHLALKRTPERQAAERRMQVMMLSGFALLLAALILALILRMVARGG